MNFQFAFDSPLFSLPEEVLFNIFGFLSYESLCNLRSVCKFFNHILKPILRHRERVIFEENCDFIVAGNYENVKVHSSKVTTFNWFLGGDQIDGKIIESLYIHNLNSTSIVVDIHDFKMMLINCPNLKELESSIEFKKTHKDDLSKNLPQLTLNLLAYAKDPEYFRIFQNSTTKKLKLFFGLDPFMANTQSIKEFLKVQTSLVDLELWFTGRGLSLFSDDQLFGVEFRLRRLKMVGKGLPFMDLKCFEMFMENHKKSLERLEIFACQNIIDGFMEYENLKTIDLQEVDVSTEPFVYAERVRLTNVKGSFVMKFPNIKTLYINTNSLTSMDFRSLKSLRTVELSVLKAEYVLLPHIVDLKLVCVTIFNKLNIPFTVQTMTFKDCMNIDWLSDYLKQNRNLRTVQIIGTSVSQRMICSIKRYSHINNCVLIF